MAEFLDLAAFADGDRKEAVGPAMVAYCTSAYEYISSAFRNLDAMIKRFSSPDKRVIAELILAQRLYRLADLPGVGRFRRIELVPLLDTSALKLCRRTTTFRNSLACVEESTPGNPANA